MYCITEMKILDFFVCMFVFFFVQGFGGRFGVQSDRVDKSAHDFNEQPERVGTNYEKPKPDIGEVEMVLMCYAPGSLNVCY
jgi:hypothetical protein